MKQLRVICNQLLAILIVFFLFSCQSNSKNAPTSIKKYSEYTDLEKMNLKGDVIGFSKYDSETSDHTSFIFINNGNISNEFLYYPLQADGSHLYRYANYIFNNNLLVFKIELSRGGDDQYTKEYEKYSYEKNLLVKINTYGDDWTERSIISYDNSGFPKKEIEIYQSNDQYNEYYYYWKDGKLDSTIRFYGKVLKDKNYYKDGRVIKKIDYNEDGSVNNKYSANFEYKLDRFNNDTAIIKKDLSGNILEGGTQTRVIKYKGEDITHYVNTLIEMHSLVQELGSDKSTTVNDFNTEIYDNSQSAPVVKEKIMCNRCGGTGQKICERCYGKGETRCYRCNGTGVANDGRRCIYCTGGYERCTGCQGRTRISCDGCASRGYTNY